MLLGGLKFDLRLYAVLLNVGHQGGSGLSAFLCTEGLVRVCAAPYEMLHKRNVRRLGAHLTNYSINKREPSFDHADDPADGTRGTKRTLSAVFAELQD